MTVQTDHEAVQSAKALDVARIRKDFPILARKIHGHPLVYLDNAATTQKPLSVVEAEKSFYLNLNSNIHRGVHTLSEEATAAYEAAREAVRGFIGAAATREIIFVKGTTDGINLVANAYGMKNIGRGDEILITGLEHHSNIVPWQLLCERTGAVLKVAPIQDDGSVRTDDLGDLMTDRTKILALAHISNALGTVNPVRSMIQMAHKRSIPVLIDGAQAVAHRSVDVQDLDADFYVFSAHKMYGPTGVGVLYGKEQLLEDMPPYQGGGDMIKSVTFEKTSYNDLPYKFEAGTPNIAGVIGLGAAISYLKSVNASSLEAHETELLEIATAALQQLDGVRIIGTAREKAGVLSFVTKNIHPHDVGTILDREGVAVRTGHHCAQPVMDRFRIPASVRASFGMYNTKEEVDRLVGGLQKVFEVFG
ncbi:MAG: cysteine desulfurase [Bacteroidota bacterium]